MRTARGVSSSVGLPRQPRPQVGARALAQAGLAQRVDQQLVAVAVEHRVEVRERADVRAEGELEADVAQSCRRPAPATPAAKRPPSVKSEIGPAPVIRSRRRRGSNHASEVSTKPYGKIATSLMPARRTWRPQAATASPCASSCTATSTKRPAEEDGAAEADVRRDHERRAVAARDRGSRRRARRRSRSTSEHDAGRPRHQRAAALAVDRCRSAGPAQGSTISRGRHQPRQPPAGRLQVCAARRRRPAGRGRRGRRAATRAGRGRWGRAAARRRR